MIGVGNEDGQSVQIHLHKMEYVITKHSVGIQLY